MNTKDQIGNLSENIVSLHFSRKIDGRYLFAVQFLGEKAELLDFKIDLLDEGGRAFGPFFFVQVKCTEKLRDKGSVSAVFAASEVRCAQGKMVPVYLAAVRVSGDDTEEVWVLAVDASLGRGVTTVPNYFNLSDKRVRLKIFDEVRLHFERNRITFVSELTRMAHRLGGPQ